MTPPLTTNDLVTWLRAQLDEDERGVYEWIRPEPDLLLTSSLRPIHEWTERVGARRVLAEVAAKRRLIAYLGDEFGSRLQIHDGIEWVDHGEIMLRLLAVPFADRPGYIKEWRP